MTNDLIINSDAGSEITLLDSANNTGNAIIVVSEQDDLYGDSYTRAGICLTRSELLKLYNGIGQIIKNNNTVKNEK